MESSGILRASSVLAVVLATTTAGRAYAQTAPPPSDPTAPAPAPTPAPAPAPTPAPPITEPATPTTPAPPPPPPTPDAHPHGHGEGEGRGPRHDDGHHHGGGRLGFGGLGFASVGMMTGGFSAMENTLSQATVFGPGYAAAPTGLVFGLGGGVLLGPVWVGAKGSALVLDSPNSSHGNAKIFAGSGGLEVGYAIVASHRWLVVPYFGAGRFQYTVDVSNTGTATLPLYAGENLTRGNTASYTAGFFTGELGVRVNRLFFLGSKGALTIGAEVGYLTSLQRAAWESSSGTTAPESAELRGGYFRLLIGGGAFGTASHDGE